MALLLSSERIEALSQGSRMSEEDQVRKARIQQNDAIAQGDLELTASFWTEDISLCRGLGGSIVGKEAYRALFDTPLHEKSLIYVREPVLVEVSSDFPLAFESGIWSARYGSASGPLAMTGRYSAQWVKSEGSWLIRSEMFVVLTCHNSATMSSAKTE